MTDTNDRPTDLRQQPGVCPECGSAISDMEYHEVIVPTGQCHDCPGQQPAQPLDVSWLPTGDPHPIELVKAGCDPVTGQPAQPGSGEASGRPISFTYNDGSGAGKEGWWSCVRELDPSDSPVVPMAAYDRLQSALIEAQKDRNVQYDRAQTVSQHNSRLWSEREALRDQLTAAQRENAALRNLAANLQPGPISEALSGQRYTTETELRDQLTAAQQRLAMLERALKYLSLRRPHSDNSEYGQGYRHAEQATAIFAAATLKASGGKTFKHDGRGQCIAELESENAGLRTQREGER